MRAGIERTVSAYGGLDFAVNDADVASRNRQLDQTALDEFERSLATDAFRGEPTARVVRSRFGAVRVDPSAPSGGHMATVSVRYIVHDVDEAIVFYTTALGFTEIMHPAPSFAMLSRGDLRLVLSAPGGPGGGGQAMADGTVPEPGGWNRFALEVEHLEDLVARLSGEGVRFRGEIIHGVGGDQAIAEDPSGNPVELFEPIRPEARL